MSSDNVNKNDQNLPVDSSKASIPSMQNGSSDVAPVRETVFQTESRLNELEEMLREFRIAVAALKQKSSSDINSNSQ